MKFPTKMYINGKLTSGNGYKQVFNPATEKEVVTVSTAGLRDIEKALQSAKNAFPCERIPCPEIKGTSAMSSVTNTASLLILLVCMT